MRPRLPRGTNVTRRFALLAAVAALACAAPAAAGADSTLLVKFASPTGAGAKVAALGDDVTGTTAGGVKVVDPRPGESVTDALASYRARPDVVYAEPNGVVHLFALSDPNDSYYTDQWALPTISALAGWSTFPGTFAAPAGAPIGIVDTGVDASHPDLVAKIASSGATCLGGSCVAGTPTDPWGHGTHVSGIAGAATNNGTGVSGVAFSSPIIPVRVFQDDGTGSPIAYDADVANGIAWAAAKGRG
jgi:thermitase